MYHTKKIFVAFVIALLVGCGSTAERKVDDLDLSKEALSKDVRLNNLASKSGRTKVGAGRLRMQIIKDAAYSWSLQEGLYQQNLAIEEWCEKNAVSMSAIFDFNQFIVNSKMLLPSVTKTTRQYEQRTSSQARTVRVGYKIVEEASIVSMPPSWRQYLYSPIDEPVEPSSALFPKNRKERLIWNSSLKDGWDEGVKIANEMFNQNLISLRNDLIGRYIFLDLYEQGVVTMPEVVTSNQSVSEFSDDRILYLNDSTHKIIEFGGYTPKEDWVPVLRGKRPAK